MATLGLSKVFILDKYFTELQKYWETEKKLQGKFFTIVYSPDDPNVLVCGNRQCQKCDRDLHRFREVTMCFFESDISW